MMQTTDGALMSKQEKLAWLGLVLTVAGCVYLIARLFFGDILPVGVPDENTARHGSRLLIVFLIGYFLVRRKDSSPFMDERDRQIEARRLHAGYTALALILLFVATVLGLDSYADFIASRSAAWIESLIMLMLLASFALHSVVGVFHYWRDRQ